MTRFRQARYPRNSNKAKFLIRFVDSKSWEIPRKWAKKCALPDKISLGNTENKYEEISHIWGYMKVDNGEIDIVERDKIGGSLD